MDTHIVLVQVEATVYVPSNESHSEITDRASALVSLALRELGFHASVTQISVVMTHDPLSPGTPIPTEWPRG